MPTINRKRKIKAKQTPYKHDNQSKQYYNNSLWFNLRNYYIKNHPLCEMCMEEGVVKEAEDVHHIIPFLTGETDEERWKLLLDEDNLKSLCSKHHVEVHNQLRKHRQNQIQDKINKNNKNIPPTSQEKA